MILAGAAGLRVSTAEQSADLQTVETQQKRLGHQAVPVAGALAACFAVTAPGGAVMVWFLP